MYNTEIHPNLVFDVLCLDILKLLFSPTEMRLPLLSDHPVALARESHRVDCPSPFPQMEEVESRNTRTKEECRELAAQLQRRCAEAMEWELELNQVSKHMMQGKEREANLLEDRATLDLRLRHRAAEAKSLYEAQTVKTKEKDREIRWAVLDIIYVCRGRSGGLSIVPKSS